MLVNSDLLEILDNSDERNLNKDNDGNDRPQNCVDKSTSPNIVQPQSNLNCFYLTYLK